MTQPTYNLAEQCIMKPFTKDLKDVCAPFSCGNGQIEQDLNDLFGKYKYSSSVHAHTIYLLSLYMFDLHCLV